MSATTPGDGASPKHELELELELAQEFGIWDFNLQSQ
jgi:hypothetical protein